MSIYDYTVETIKGVEAPLSNYKGKVLLIVNTASKCGFTPQFDGLQKLYDKYQDQGFVILGFPSNQFMNQEPGTNEDIQDFCRLNYGVNFPIFSKMKVRGRDAHPLFKYLIKQAPGFLSNQVKWNFTKFLINRDGKVIERFSPNKDPKDLEADIKNIL